MKVDQPNRFLPLATVNIYSERLDVMTAVYVRILTKKRVRACRPEGGCARNRLVVNSEAAKIIRIRAQPIAQNEVSYSQVVCSRICDEGQATDS